MGNQPMALFLDEDGRATPASSGFFARNLPAPAEFIMAGGHRFCDGRPDDVVQAVVLVLDESEGLFKGRLGRCVTHERVLGEHEHGVVCDAWGDLFPGVRVELINVVG